jgi:hypothetical protein
MNHAAAASDAAAVQLLRGLIDELKLQSPRFATQNQSEQQIVIDRLAAQVQHEVDILAARIATRSFPAGAAKITSMSIGGESVSVKLSMPQSSSMVHAIADHVGGSCWLVLCELEEFTGGLGTVKAPPDQGSLLGNDAEP